MFLRTADNLVFCEILVFSKESRNFFSVSFSYYDGGIPNSLGLCLKIQCVDRRVSRKFWYMKILIQFSLSFGKNLGWDIHPFV